MDNFKTAFPEKLKTIRNTYNIKNRDLRDYCKKQTKTSISTGAISFWETGKNKPNIESITTIANFFCITLDWLLMPEEYPKETMYDKAKIQYFENKKLNNQEITRILPIEYQNETIRNKLPLEARANIIVLSSILSCKGIQEREGQKALEDIKEILETQKPKYKVRW